MADNVRHLLEEMVPELEDLEGRGYFSRSEIKQIVQRRQDFEYALKRMAALKEDFLRYVDYECKLEELRLHRRREHGIKGKMSLADYCIPRRVHFIYERALRKFRGDLTLWSRWLQYCQRNGASRQMSKVLTRALQLHPTAAALWTYAAAWEFEHNLNAAAARALMQRGLRMCKDAPELWHEYFRMELLYALRLRERRVVLGIADAGGPESSEAGEGEESAAAVQAVLNGAVAAVVFKSAVAAIPDSLPFRARFLHLLAPLDFPGKAALEEAMYAGIAADFSGSAAAWDLRARRPLLSLPAGADSAAVEAALQAALQGYEQGLEAVPTAQMVDLLAAFLREQIEVLQEQQLGSSQGVLHQRLVRLFHEAAEAGHASKALLLGWPAVQLHYGQPRAALDAARTAAGAMPASAPVWQQLLQLEAFHAAQQLEFEGPGATEAGNEGSHTNGGQASSSDEEEEEEEEGFGVQRTSFPALRAGAGRSRAAAAAATRRALEAVVLRAVRAVPLPAAPPVWLEGVQALVGCGCSLEALCCELADVLAGQARGPVQGGMGGPAAALLHGAFRAGGLSAARQLYRALLRLPPAGGVFFHAVLDLELAAAAAEPMQLGAGSSGGGSVAVLTTARLRELFEAAVGAYGSQDAQLWLRYAQFEQEQEQLRPASGGCSGQVYWRALKTLSQPGEFEALYQQRFTLQQL